MLFWFFSDGWKSTLPTIGRARFQSSEEYTSTHRKSTLPVIGNDLFYFRPVASSYCQHVRETVAAGFA